MGLGWVVEALEGSSALPRAIQGVSRGGGAVDPWRDDDDEDEDEDQEPLEVVRTRCCRLCLALSCLSASLFPVEPNRVRFLISARTDLISKIYDFFRERGDSSPRGPLESGIPSALRTLKCVICRCNELSGGSSPGLRSRSLAGFSYAILDMIGCDSCRGTRVFHGIGSDRQAGDLRVTFAVAQPALFGVYRVALYRGMRAYFEETVSLTGSACWSRLERDLFPGKNAACGGESLHESRREDLP